VYLIASTDLSLVDILISTSGSDPLLPEGYALLRQIGGFVTDSEGAIGDVTYYGVAADTNNSDYG
jgi:hypothetical protein